MANFDLNDIPISMQFFITALICGVVFYFAYMIDFSSLHHVIASSQRQEADLKVGMEAALDTEAAINADLSQLPQLQKTLKTWQNTLVKSAELPDLLNEILKLGTANNLQFDIFSPGEKTKDGDYIKVPIKAVITGNYDQVASFLSQVANMSWLVGINNFVIEEKNLTTSRKPGAAELDGQLIAEVTLEVYSLPDQPEVTHAAT